MAVTAFDPSSAVPVTAATSAPAASASTFDPSSAVPVSESGTSAPLVDTGLKGWENAAGLVGRAGMKGAAGLAGMVATAIGNASDVEDVPGDAPAPSSMAPTGPYQGPQLSDFVHPERWQQAAEYFADKMGLPKPQTPGERVIGAAVQALPAAALAPEAEAPAAVADAAPTVAGVLKSVPSVVKDIVSTPAVTAASGAASQGVQEAGGGPGLQLAAGLAAGGLPAIGAGGAALARGLTRGGAEGAAAANARIADAAASGTTLTAGQATGSRTLQAIEGASSKLWGGGALKSLVNSQDAHVGNTVRQIADNLAGDQEATPMTAGDAINAGAKTAKASVRAAESAAYGRVDALVPPDTQVNVSGTLDKLNTLATPTPGAEATTGALIPKEISAMRENMTADAGSAGTMPYSAVRALRTAVGNSIDWGFAPADPVKNGALKQVYGALTNDLNTTASAASPEAAEAVRAANALHQANVAQSDVLDTVVNKSGGPEAVYNAALSGARTGATKIRAVMSALNPDQQNLFRATVIGKLGLVPASKQGATGEVFRLDSFLTHWNQLRPEAKDALFGASGPTNSVRRALDSVANTAADIRGNTLLKNPSGTGETYAHAITLWDLLEGVGSTALAIHEGSGEMLHSAAMGAAAVVGNMGIARLLTRPWFARWLATSTKLPPSAVPGAIAALQRASVAQGSQDGVNVSRALASQLAAKPGASPRSPIKISSPQEAAEFPVGTHVQTPDGQIHVRRVYKRGS